MEETVPSPHPSMDTVLQPVTNCGNHSPPESPVEGLYSKHEDIRAQVYYIIRVKDKRNKHRNP